MTAGNKRPVAIVRTRPLGQGNYGGILQAYALQQALEELGAEPRTDLSPGVARDARISNLIRNIKSAIRIALTRMGVPRHVSRAWVEEAIRKSRDQELMRFVAENISTVRLYGASGRVDEEELARADLFVTGSDQVWRARFGRVPTYLFDFLRDDDTRPRIAYAASFGTDENEFSADLASLTRPLAQRLSAASVRETGGIELARRLWNIEAEHVVDPTMLLNVDRYSALADKAIDPIGAKPLVTYVLDRHPATLQSVTAVAAILGSQPMTLAPSVPASFRDYRSAPQQYARPSIEAWLGAVRDSDFVVTDSFHGTVFALLFNRPFLSIANKERGASRFESLLRVVGLEDRLVLPGSTPSVAIVENPIDWEDVNARIRVRQQQSVVFLKKAIASASFAR
ncbi:polysaccharide pyruvyl transferase family protein [Microbacterium abyssi]|uniref:polysaccharide pyruvyl transferase family protein n=1 Tax=Microbacterium abyssi TaxID=2782166 RepID=UPI001888CB17|nr:polysaccharide pyruvyl transferase family protein [Microbacterium sp. A18JL241]